MVVLGPLLVLPDVLSVFPRVCLHKDLTARTSDCAGLISRWTVEESEFLTGSVAARTAYTTARPP